MDFLSELCGCPKCIRKDLEQYQSSIRYKMREKQGHLFPVKTPKYEAIVYKEFIWAAKQHVYILCNDIRENIHTWVNSFSKDDNIDIKVIVTRPLSKVTCQGVAKYLSELGYIKSCPQYANLPNFLLVDNLYFRLVIDAETNYGTVSCYAQQNDELKEMANKMYRAMNHLWSDALSDKQHQKILSISDISRLN